MRPALHMQCNFSVSFLFLLQAHWGAPKNMKFTLYSCQYGQCLCVCVRVHVPTKCYYYSTVLRCR